MHRYRIGVFSQISGVSKDTLRYYDKAGVLHPSCKEENGYRSYTEYDLMQLMQIRTLRGLDASLEECARITALSAMWDELSQREVELNRQIARLTKLRDRIHMLQAEIESCFQQCGQCQRCDTLPTYYVELTDMTERKRQLINQWMRHTPYVHLSFCFPTLNEAPSPTLLIGILKTYAQARRLSVEEAEERPARPAVRCVLRMADPMRPTPEELSPMNGFMREKHLEPIGPWTYRLRFIDRRDDGTVTYYVGACVPIRQACP